MIRFPDRSKWENRFHFDRTGELVWYIQMDPRKRKALIQRCMDMAQETGFTLALGQYTNVFQAQVCAINAVYSKI
jgi:hypothetical protein